MFCLGVCDLNLTNVLVNVNAVSTKFSLGTSVFIIYHKVPAQCLEMVRLTLKNS